MKGLLGPLASWASSFRSEKGEGSVVAGPLCP